MKIDLCSSATSCWKGKKLLLGIVFLTFLSLTIMNVFAELQYSQLKENLGNGTIANRLVLGYSKGGFGIANDYVKANNPFEVYIQYNIYPKTFNQNNPDFLVTYCNFKIQYWGKLDLVPKTVFEQNYTDSDLDINKAQYFFQLYDGDQAIAQQTCYFENKSFDELLLPMEMQMVTPTNQCKACQLFEWSKLQADVNKAKSVGDHVVEISGWIEKIVLLNFEIILALFWIALILLVFLIIGMIFLVAFWLYHFLARIIK